MPMLYMCCVCVCIDGRMWVVFMRNCLCCHGELAPVRMIGDLFIAHLRFATLSDIKQYIVRHLEEQNEAISKASLIAHTGSLCVNA